MGTVALGGVVVTMQHVDEGVERQGAGDMVDSLDNLLAGFEEGVRSSVPTGESNATWFQAQVDGLLPRLHAQAARVGIYLAIEIDANAPTEVWDRPDRCASYDPDRTGDGIVVGAESETGRATIVGAVFDVSATDGRQTARFPHYVKLHDCLPGTLDAWFSGLHVTDGWVLDPDNAKDAQDSNAVMAVGELPQGSMNVTHNVTLDESSFSHNGWNQETAIKWDDGSASNHPATPHSDFLLFRLDTGTTPASTELTDVGIHLDAWHENVEDDYLQVRALHNGTVVGLWAPATNTTEQTFWLDLPVSPSGRPYWTAEELAALEIEIQVIEVVTFDPPAFFYVDYVDVTYEYTAPERYVFEAVVDWPRVPSVYENHTLEMRYRFTESTPGETFLLQFDVNGTWTTRATIAATGGTWDTLNYTLQPDDLEAGVVEMRIIDGSPADHHPGDGDTFEVDYLRLRHEVSDP